MFLSRKIATGLWIFIEMNRHGMPAFWDSDESNHDVLLKEYEPVWEAILYKTMDGFERMARDDGWEDLAGEYEYRDECLDLFREFFQSLWD